MSVYAFKDVLFLQINKSWNLEQVEVSGNYQ